jgi:hypothetical protein
MTTRYLIDTPHGIARYRGKWNVAITDMSGAAQWAQDCANAGGADWAADGMTAGAVARAIREGDMEMAQASEKYMEAFESLSFTGRKARTVAAVCGGAANVAAHLAGSPLAMRRRERIMSDMGTLTVFIDGSSSGDVGTDALKRRGAALLGLVRMLTAVRPVELYIVGGGMYGVPTRQEPARPSGSVFVRIDTGTMDLSRDGFAVAHPAFTRSFLYRASVTIPERQQGETRPWDGGLGWEFGGVDVYRAHALGAFCRALDCDPSQSIFFSPPHSSDPIIDNPVAWIRDMLALYGGQTGAGE